MTHPPFAEPFWWACQHPERPPVPGVAWGYWCEPCRVHALASNANGSFCEPFWLTVLYLDEAGTGCYTRNEYLHGTEVRPPELGELHPADHWGLPAGTPYAVAWEGVEPYALVPLR